MHKSNNKGWINIYNFIEETVDDFYEEETIEVWTPFNDVKTRFHVDLHENFLCTILILLHKLLINMGIVHIIYRRLPFLALQRIQIGKKIKESENTF